MLAEMFGGGFLFVKIVPFTRLKSTKLSGEDIDALVSLLVLFLSFRLRTEQALGLAARSVRLLAMSNRRSVSAHSTSEILNMRKVRAVPT